MDRQEVLISLKIEIKIKTPLSEEVSVEYTNNISFNTSVNDSLFNFKIPPDVKIKNNIILKQNCIFVDILWTFNFEVS